MNICKVLCDEGACVSMSQSRRLISFGTVFVNGVKAELDTQIETSKDVQIKVGKKEIIRKFFPLSS